MQYLLTEDEYSKLKAAQSALDKANKKKLQAFCTLAAQHIPVKIPWKKNEPPEPWGCILVNDENNPMYCDECPASLFCPSPDQEYSQ